MKTSQACPSKAVLQEHTAGYAFSAHLHGNKRSKVCICRKHAKMGDTPSIISAIHTATCFARATSGAPQNVFQVDRKYTPNKLHCCCCL